MKYLHCEPNQCKYQEHGYCSRIALMYQDCPSYLRWNDDGSNNLPCDFVGYDGTKEDENATN